MDLNLTPEQTAVLERAAAKRTAEQAEKLPPFTAESLAQWLLDQACDSYAFEEARIVRESLASNERLMALGSAVAAQPDKLDAVEKAVQQILS